jgi:plasmid stabilization system protein ParE
MTAALASPPPFRQWVTKHVVIRSLPSMGLKPADLQGLEVRNPDLCYLVTTRGPQRVTALVQLDDQSRPAAILALGDHRLDPVIRRLMAGSLSAALEDARSLAPAMTASLSASAAPAAETPSPPALERLRHAWRDICLAHDPDRGQQLFDALASALDEHARHTPLIDEDALRPVVEHFLASATPVQAHALGRQLTRAIYRYADLDAPAIPTPHPEGGASLSDVLAHLHAQADRLDAIVPGADGNLAAPPTPSPGDSLETFSDLLYTDALADDMAQIRERHPRTASHPSAQPPAGGGLSALCAPH